MPNSTQSLSSLLDQAADSLRRYYSADTSDADRTKCLRDTAAAFVNARDQFYTREGTPDYLGRTYAYRRWVREVFSKANVPGDEQNSLQSAIRYHTGNLLRDRLDADQIEALGLKHSSPRQRSTEKRERTSETLSLFGAGPAVTDADDVVQAVELFNTFLRRVHPATLDAPTRRRVAAALRGLADSAGAVAEEAGRRRR